MLFNSMIAAAAGLILAAFYANKVLSIKVTDSRVEELSTAIRQGSMAFLKRMYSWISVFVVILAILISTLTEWGYPWGSVAFIAGALLSSLAGFVGMRIATAANGRTTEAARDGGTLKALPVAFRGGAVMGFTVAGLGLLGVALGYYLFIEVLDLPNGYDILAAIGLGGSSIALFARVGGGIYTKAADVGADLVGKVEAGIPEDDPRNPATIADNVGDNVGDVAGMGADLFGSYVATVLASMVLGNYVINDNLISTGNFLDNHGPIMLPMMIAGVGIIFSIIGTFFIRIKDNCAKEPQVQRALNMGNWVSIILTGIGSYVLIQMLLPETLSMKFFGEGFKAVTRNDIFGAVIVGLVVGALISYFTEYYTGLGKKPILDIVQKSATGAATNIIAGLGVGMISTFAPILLFAAAIWSSYAFAGFYGVAIAASAMMATTAMQLAIDAFGPIADNAGGIAEMSDLPDEVRERTDILDSLVNTTAAIGKGFAIASAALTALALFAAFVTFTGIDGINIFKAPVLAMLFVGGMVPVVFSALAMNAVGKAAMEMVKEVRRQFKEIPGIMEYKAEPEYDKCVAISTEASLKEMMLPGAMTILFPLVLAFLPMAFGYTGQEAAEMLGGYMAGVAVSGVLWAIFQNNAGGAWDNAKKSFEAGVMIDGEMTYKGSEAHKAAVTGDTVGDPFKDTSGPSMNILIKLTCLVGLVIAPILGDGHDSHSEVAQSAPVELRQEVMKMKIKGVEAQVHGPIYQGVVKADMDIAVDSERVLEAVIKFASEDGSFEATFSGAEGIFDGMMFHASGTVTTKDESQFGADVDFHRNENGDVMDFNIAIH